MPSMKIAVGTNKIKEMMLITEKRLMLSKVSCQEHIAGCGPNQKNAIKQFQ